MCALVTGVQTCALPILPQVRDQLLRAGRIEAIDLPGLSDERRPIIAGGVLVLEVAFAALGLERMAVSKAALREGVLHDMVGRSRDEDPRDAAVAALMKRYGIDVDQELRVERTALHLLDQVPTAWPLGPAQPLLPGRVAPHDEVGP